jgi:hypothetical protein
MSLDEDDQVPPTESQGKDSQEEQPQMMIQCHLENSKMMTLKKNPELSLLRLFLLAPTLSEEEQDVDQELVDLSNASWASASAQIPTLPPASFNCPRRQAGLPPRFQDMRSWHSSTSSSEEAVLDVSDPDFVPSQLVDETPVQRDTFALRQKVMPSVFDQDKGMTVWQQYHQPRCKDELSLVYGGKATFHLFTSAASAARQSRSIPEYENSVAMVTGVTELQDVNRMGLYYGDNMMKCGHSCHYIANLPKFIVCHHAFGAPQFPNATFRRSWQKPIRKCCRTCNTWQLRSGLKRGLSRSFRPSVKLNSGSRSLIRQQ